MTKSSVFSVSIILQFFILCRLTISFTDFMYFDYPPLVYKYNRLSEIETECNPFLSSASQLKPDDSRSYKLKKELSFFNGDWNQESGGSPLMPFDDSDIPRTSSLPYSPLRLVGFEVKDVNPDHHFQNGVSLQGTMCIGIARNTSLLYDSFSTFHFSPGMSVLKISFEGVYMEMVKNEEERLLCMLGNTTLPIRELQDDRILLVLRYPKTFRLNKRAILGELRSLNEQGNDKYFDLVHILSQLGQYSKYQFSSENLKSRSCDSSVYQVELEEDGTNSFSHSEFCDSLLLFSADLFTIVPNWRFTDSDRDNYLRYENVSLVIQNLKCEQETNDNNNSSRVAAVFRMFPSQQMDQSMAAAMSGLSSDKTLSVEGTWDASKGQLCMVGCLEECNYQVSLYFPRSFSIKQRSAIFGSISSFRNEVNNNTYVPLIFELETPAIDLFFHNHPQYTKSYLSHNYSKIELANAFRERNHFLGFFADFKKLFLTYPALPVPDGNHDIFSHLSALSSELNILAPCIQETDIFFAKIEVVSLGHLLGQHHTWLQGGDSFSIKDRDEIISNSDLLNISLSLRFTKSRLSFTEKYYKNISKLTMEGLYDPSTGEMHLIGCRKILAKPAESSDTERGYDCLIEVKVLYAAKTMKWLINPTAKITITSQRKNGDSLYFSPIELQTSMVSYDRYEQDAVFRKVFEQILRNLMMATVVVLILGQYKYIKENVNSVPYISRVMLSFQLVGYGLPLIRDTKILFPEKEFQSLQNFYGYEKLLKVLDFTGKVLVLAAFLLTGILSGQVAKIRKKHNHFSCDKQVFLITSTIYAVGYLIYCHMYEESFQNLMKSTVKNDQKMKILTYKEEEYIGFIQDLFLLPQIIGNMLWRSRVRPLGKFYYIGFTMIRIFLIFYDCVRDPALDPYSDDETAVLNLHLIFTSRELKLVVAVSMVVLTVVIYIQQNQKYYRLMQLPKHTVFKFLSSKST